MPLMGTQTHARPRREPTGCRHRLDLTRASPARPPDAFRDSASGYDCSFLSAGPRPALPLPRGGGRGGPTADRIALAPTGATLRNLAKRRCERQIHAGRPALGCPSGPAEKPPAGVARHAISSPHTASGGSDPGAATPALSRRAPPSLRRPGRRLPPPLLVERMRLAQLRDLPRHASLDVCVVRRGKDLRDPAADPAELRLLQPARGERGRADADPRGHERRARLPGHRVLV